MKRHILAATAAAALVLGTAPLASAAPADEKDNLNQRTDADGNGYPDTGQVVTGQQRSTVVDGDTTCELLLTYRGSFDNDPYMDSGWMRNNYHCTGAEPGQYTYLIVHESDPRYSQPGEPIWNTWKIIVETVSGSGNVIRTDRIEQP